MKNGVPARTPLGRVNALNLVRLVLASLVLISHSFPVAGRSEPRPLGGWTLGEWSVAGFFCISGYLIAGSRVNSSLRSYAWRRGLRIFPGLVCALVLTAFALAPWAAHWEGSTWSASEAARYIAQNLAMYNAPFGIGTTLDSVPLRFAWNGSLWTLLYELLAYAAVGLLLTPRLVRRHARLVVGILLLGTTLVGPWVNTNVDFNLYRHAVHLGTFFLAGAFLQTLGSHLRLSATGGIVSLALVAVLGITQPSGAAWVALPLSYALLWLGGALPHLFTTNDVSYGLYIYAFPIQQTLTLLTHNLNPYALMFAALIPTTALATLSWHTVEKPALRLKRYVR